MTVNPRIVDDSELLTKNIYLHAVEDINWTCTHCNENKTEACNWNCPTFRDTERFVLCKRNKWGSYAMAVAVDRLMRVGIYPRIIAKRAETKTKTRKKSKRSRKTKKAKKNKDLYKTFRKMLVSQNETL